VYINLTRGPGCLLMDDNTGTDSAGHARVMLDLSQFDLVVLSASEQELAAHEDVLNQIDKSSGGKTVWRVKPVTP
jgi:DNA polymerase-3 subunit epsilon